MKLPWRCAISTLLTLSVTLVYILCRKAVAPDRLDHGNTSYLKIAPLGGHEESFAINDEAGRSLRCERGFRDNKGCGQFLTCRDIEEVVLERRIGEGAVKQVYLGRWRGMQVAHSSLVRSDHHKDFLHGAEMLQALQSSPFVVRLLGLCLKSPSLVIITEYHPLESADKIEDVFARDAFSSRNTIKTRFQLCLDYVGIIAFLHSSPVGTRIMCDSNDVTKMLSQFLITEDLRLIVNDLDALPRVDSASGMLATCGHKELDGDFVAPEQLWPFPDRDFCDDNMPPYDEKSDIWKVPSVVDTLLGSVDHSNIVRLHLFKIHRRCKELDAQLRPTADEILETYRETFDSIVN